MVRMDVVDDFAKVVANQRLKIIKLIKIEITD
jgi:hypothetical protein